jgi:hypothetical protein
VNVVTKNLFLQGEHGRKLRDRLFGYFTVEEHIGKHSYILKLPTIVRLHRVFHVNSLRTCSTTSPRHVVMVAAPEGDDDELGVSQI